MILMNIKLEKRSECFKIRRYFKKKKLEGNDKAEEKLCAFLII